MLVEGVIASAPDANRRVTVTIPTFHPDQTFGPCPYMPRGGALPTVGARCLVWLDETGVQEPWVPAWDGPDGAAGGTYISTSEKAAANGVATLDGNTRVPNAQLGAGTVDATKFLRGDRTWAVPSGGGPASVGSLTYGSGFSAGAGGLNTPRCWKLPSGLVVLSGAVQKSSALAAGDLILTLATGFQPTVGVETFPVWSYGSNPGGTHVLLRIDLDASGALTVSGASGMPSGSTPFVVFLGGIHFIP